MFISIYAHIPLIIVGKPGISKSLSVQLFIKNIFDEQNSSYFLKNYPKINFILFKGSEMNTPEMIKNIFTEVENKMNTLLIFEHLDLLENNQNNYLEILNSKLEISLNDVERKKQFSFIGICNSKLDPAKMNRAIFLSSSNILLDDIYLTIESIAKSYNEKLFKKYQSKYKSLGNTFYFYREKLMSLKDEFIINFHDGRDFYNIIKTFSGEMLKNNMPEDPNIIDKAFNKSLAKNLNGLEINGKSSLKLYIKDIDFDDLNTVDLIKDNINNKDDRFLLLISEKNMFGFLIDIIKKEIEKLNNKNYIEYIDSPLKGDKVDIFYNNKMMLNIERNVSEGKIIILNNLEQIYSVFYDLFEKNLIIKDGKKYYKIYYGINTYKLSYFNENTKIIVLIDKNDLRKQKKEFLDRFIKYNISFDDLLNEEDKEKSIIINNILKKLASVKDIYYNLNNILVNTNEDIINGYVYLYKDKEKNSYKDIIREQIIPILPQDIIFTLFLSELNKEEEKKEFNLLQKDLDLINKYNSLDEYLKDDKRGKENILIIYTVSKIGEKIKLSEHDNYMEILIDGINSSYKFKKILNEFNENKKYELLILKLERGSDKYINYLISQINIYKEINKLNDDTKKIIFILNIQREFDLSKETNKIATILTKDDNINQLFIDNINGGELSIKDAKKINIHDFINKNENYKNLIIETLLNFLKENKNEQLGKYKGIDTNNYIQEFKNFIEQSEEILNSIKSIVLSKFDNDENITESLIKNKYITQNTVDFTSSMISYMKNIFKEKTKMLLIKTENNNFFTTIFMLNVNNIEKENIISKEYSLNISDIDILNNEIVTKIKKEFLKSLREKKNEIMDNIKINIKLNYKIPGLFNTYKEIKAFIEKEKLSLLKDETELRKCKIELVSQSVVKLKNDIKIFNEKLYNELTTKQLMNKVIQIKKIDKTYNDFVELFLNDYITFYLEQLYNDNNKNYYFLINDNQHRIILLLIDLKFKDLKSFQNVIDKILWLESNSNYIKDIIDIFNIISENIINDEKDEDFLFKQLLYYISLNDIKYRPKESQLKEINSPYYIIIIVALFKFLINEETINNAVNKNKNDNGYSYFKYLEEALDKMLKLDNKLKLDLLELKILNDFIIINNIFECQNKKDSLNENLKDLINDIKKGLYVLFKKNENKLDIVYYELISNIILNEFMQENNLNYRFYILKEFLFKDEKLYIKINKLTKIILKDLISADINKYQESLNKLSDIKELNNSKITIKFEEKNKSNNNNNITQNKDSIHSDKKEKNSTIINFNIFGKIKSLISFSSQDEKNLFYDSDKKVKNDNITLTIIEIIKSIIKFSKQNKQFFIYFHNEFWIALLNINNEVNSKNISVCYKLREVFVEYYKLINEIFELKKNIIIKNEAINLYNKDEFSSILEQMIQKYINDNKRLISIEKLWIITKYNPYYIEDRYSNIVNCEIFDLFDLKDVHTEFIEEFQRINFEKIFNKKIKEYINKLISKVKTINDFGIMLNLINVERISEKNIYLEALNGGYENIIKPQIELLKDKKLTDANKIVAKIALINYNYEIKEKKFNFIKDKIKKLNEDIMPLIFIEIIKLYIEKDEKVKEEFEEEGEIIEDDKSNNGEIIEYICNEFINKLNDIKDINNIINLLDCLEQKNKTEKK